MVKYCNPIVKRVLTKRFGLDTDLIGYGGFLRTQIPVFLGYLSRFRNRSRVFAIAGLIRLLYASIKSFLYRGSGRWGEHWDSKASAKALARSTSVMVGIKLRFSKRTALVLVLMFPHFPNWVVVGGMCSLLRCPYNSSLARCYKVFSSFLPLRYLWCCHTRRIRFFSVMRFLSFGGG